jgi:hypothetical protein|tara:strand:- start:799 stop:1062 length:264 start_codon:yes stop_codon:yes gene_type:complete
MFNIIITFILTSAFFILFFTPDMKIKVKSKKKEKEKEKPSTTRGFIEDTYRGPITDRFIPPKVGKTGTFVGYTDVPEYGWISGFPVN